MKKSHTFAAISSLLACASAVLPVSALAGAVPDAIDHFDRVSEGMTDVYHVTFEGEESAEVKVVAPEEDLDLMIYDENGRSIKEDTDHYNPSVTWTPRWTGKFTIKIRNNENHDVHYELLTN